MSVSEVAAAPGLMETVIPHTSVAPETATAPNPFVGLVPLNEQNASLLAGREEEVRILTTNLRAARLTLVYGASGVGKSSLLRAGVVATLRELANEELNRFGAPSFAVVVISSWSGDPFEQLRLNIREGLSAALQVESIPPLPPSTDLVEIIRNCNNSCGVELLIILDQFEEFFLYHEGQTGPSSFAYEFPRAVNATDIKARFLVSLRDDSLYKLDSFQNALPALFENRLAVEPLTVKNAEQAIEKARTTYNGSPRAITQVTIEPGLVTAVLDQVRYDNLPRDGAAIIPWAPTASSAEARFIDAPYMQLVMSRLWEEESKRWLKEKKPENTLRLEAFNKLGTAQNVVQQHLDNIMKSFSSRERKVASDAFSCLVTPGGSKYALTPAELHEWTQQPEQALRLFLEKLSESKYRVVRRVNKKTVNGTEVAYEAHHDRLALAMRSWHIQYQKLLAERRARIWQYIGFGIVVIIVGSLVVQSIRLSRREAAEMHLKNLTDLKDKKVNEQDAQLKEIQQDLNISASADSTDRAKLTALRALAPKVTCKDVSSNKDSQEINKILGLECAPVEAAPNAQKTPRLYVHIQDEDQRDSANQLKEWLQTQNYKLIVPGVENVGQRLLRNSEVRYFQDNTYELNFAWLISSSLKEKCVDVRPKLVKGFEDSQNIREGHFELWLTRDSLYNYGCYNSPGR